MAKTGKCFRCSKPSNGKAGGMKERCDACLPASTIRYNEWKVKHPNAIKEQAARWRKNNPERKKFHGRKYELKKQYGITIEEYEAMVAAQGGRCAICERKPNDKLCVDHDHKTNEVRGLLCRKCNLGLGGFEDDAASLLSAERYIQFYKRRALSVAA